MRIATELWRYELCLKVISYLRLTQDWQKHLSSLAMTSRENENSNKSLNFLQTLVSSNPETCFIQVPEINNEELNVPH